MALGAVRAIHSLTRRPSRRASRSNEATAGISFAAADEPEDLPIPGQTYTFGVVEQAQALGDFAVLGFRGRRALRVHLGRDVDRGLDTLARAMQEALAA